MDKIIQGLANPYDLLIMPHPSIRSLDGALLTLTNHGVHPINVGALIASEVSPSSSNPSREIKSILDRRITIPIQIPILLHAIDILFHPAFNLDPLAIFRKIAKIKPVVVLWPGSFTNHSLSYAVPEHAHYRVWKLSSSDFSNPLIRIHNLGAN